jgi:hypothetical protein
VRSPPTRYAERKLSFGRGRHLHRQTLRLRSVAGPGRRPCRVSVPLRKACAPVCGPALDDGTNPAPCEMGAQARSFVSRGRTRWLGTKRLAFYCPAPPIHAVGSAR